jgi:AcrR family transcriptional regulator
VALGLFWAQGYEATSVDAVTAATGVNASSLYAAFTNKRGLFRAAVDRYRSTVGAALDELRDGDGGIDDVVAFVDWVRTGIISDTQPNGCLIVNTMVEQGRGDAELAAVAGEHRDALHASLAAALTRADREGEIEPGTAELRASLVQAAIFGALATGQAGAVDEADRMLRSLIEEIERWRSRDGRS